ncbi:hypothetical protein HDV04_006299 [Boothiomyces sp. JEL0838]|nr:hypothetical protein HDV04_006299 [Boothiomyces sp. JEL0838]
MKFLTLAALLVAAAAQDTNGTDYPRNDTESTDLDNSFSSVGYRNFEIPEADGEDLNEGFTVYNGTNGRALRVKVEDKKVIVFSFNPSTNATTALRFNVKNEPRLGLEWHRASSALNDTKAPPVAFATRMMGLFETNPTSNTFWNTTGTQYLFRNWNWSDISITWANNSNSIPTLYLNSIGSPSNQTNPKVNLTVEIPSNSYNAASGFTISPTGLKYDFDIIGQMNYTLAPATSSSWQLVSRVFTSTANATFSNDTIADANNAAKLQWIRNLTVDGQPANMIVNGIMPIPSKFAWGTGDISSRDEMLDNVCSKMALVQTFPYFNQSVYWDPLVNVDENQALNAAIASSAFKKAGYSLTSMAVVLITAIFLL